MTAENVTILVVDDDTSHCTILQALLRGWGYEVSLAHNGRQALEQVRERVFDLVLCDIRMAEMDGIETLKEIKAYNPSIPVLIMTAFGLAVAIPAVLGYNAIVRGNKGVLGSLNSFAHDMHAFFVTGTRMTVDTTSHQDTKVLPLKKGA